MENRTIILCPNPDRDHGMKATKAAIRLLQELGFRTVVCSPFRDPKAGAFGDLTAKPLLPELKNAHLIVTLGGDGTILHLAKLAALHRIPMLGINMGGLGFLAELEVSSLEAMRGLQGWNFPVEERMMLDVAVLRDGKQIYTSMGLNEAVIREGPISHVIHLKISSDGKHLADIAGDGVIVATPTGSTAYSMSAGGPILEPRLDCICLTPICPHTPGSRPILVRGDTVIELCRIVSKDTAVYISTDGSEVSTVCHGDTVRITRADHVTKLIRLKDEGFLGVLRDKFSTQL